MPARHIKAGRAYINPGAVATAQQHTVTVKTQGPCDYINLKTTWQGTATAGLTNGLQCGLDRIEVQMNSAEQKGNEVETGSIFYTFFGGRDCAAVYAAGGCVSHGMLETVSRMLFHTDALCTGVPLGTAAMHSYSVINRLPIGKNVPVEVSITVYVAPTARWCVAGWVYTLGQLLLEPYVHLVDSVADLKVKMIAKTNCAPQTDGEMWDIPDEPSYWFLGWSCDIRVAAGAPYADSLGGGASAPTVVHDGFARITNSDGLIFDEAAGEIIKADMLERNSPIHNWLTLDLYSDRLYGIGQYSRLMPAPIEAKSLKLQVHPNSAGLATDLYRCWFFFSKKGNAVKVVNAQQTQSADWGAAGQTQAQELKK